jgi:hypothetical protein
MVAHSKANYYIQLAAYTPSKRFMQKRQEAAALKSEKSLQQAAKKKKDLLALKRPQSAYILWSATKYQPRQG